jgi:hypothetical protein
MKRRFGLPSAITASVALAGCSAQQPFDGVQFCLASMKEADELKNILNTVSKKNGLSFTDESASVKKDLQTLGSPLSRHPIIYLLVRDDGWLPNTGPIMINNVGAPSPQEVHVSFFRGNPGLGGDHSEKIAQNLTKALATKWSLSDYPGFELEGERPLC